MALANFKHYEVTEVMSFIKCIFGIFGGDFFSFALLNDGLY